jgi:hypothetical protein
MHNAAEPGMAQAHIESRRARLREALRRPHEPSVSDAEDLPPGSVEHLRDEAENLFWNELSWEQLTDEEAVVGGHLTELVFPAFLSFVDGLLLERAGDLGLPARRHTEIVEEILGFLGHRFADFTVQLAEGADSERIVWARAMTARLIDLVLYRLFDLTEAEREEIERGE